MCVCEGVSVGVTGHLKLNAVKWVFLLATPITAEQSTITTATARGRGTSFMQKINLNPMIIITIILDTVRLH